MANVRHTTAHAVVGIVFCCLASGCLPIPYIYPKLSYIPPVSVSSTGDRVYVFRVQGTFKQEQYNENFFISGQPAMVPHHKIRLLSTEDVQTISSQTCLTFEKGIVWWPLFQSTEVHDLSLRLYRPGYKTVEFHGWTTPSKIIWEEVRGMTDQELALDRVWSCPPAKWEEENRDLPESWRYKASKNSRTALAFLASEYERLAWEQQRRLMAGEIRSSASEDCWKRMRNKGAYLRKLSENP